MDINLTIEDTFTEISFILIAAAIIGSVGRLLKQPLIVVFIALGILLGPSALNIIQSTGEIHLLSEMGVAVLLFVVGLKLDLTLIKSLGKVALMTGLGQVIFTSVIGYLIALLFGYSSITSLYIAIALTFSSTIIIVKLLSDKKEIDSLHGQIALGFLIVQDIVVIFLMIMLSAFNGGVEDNHLILEAVYIIVKGVALIFMVGLLIKFIIPRLAKFLAGSQELLVLFSIAWATFLASSSEMLGFSKEVGAFLAGVSLASTPYREVISGRLLSLRDFLLLFFFIYLGSELDLSKLNNQIVPSLVLSLFVLVGNPLIVMIIMGLMKYKKRTSFLAGLTVAQISEFSLILTSLGYDLGHIDAETVGLVTLVGLITISLSSYMIIYSHPIFDKLSPWLNIFEKKDNLEEAKLKLNSQRKIEIILFGLGRYGSNIAHKLEKEGFSVLGIDFDPQLVARWQKIGKDALYGDADDPDIADQIPLRHCLAVISTINFLDINLSLIKTLRRHGFQGKIIATSHKPQELQKLEEAGADFTLYPFSDAADVIVERLEQLDIQPSHNPNNFINS